jgi:hypothetical protein
LRTNPTLKAFATPAFVTADLRWSLRMPNSMKALDDETELASMDPVVLMKNLDHTRMTSRRPSYILQQQVHLYTPEANKLRDEIDLYVEAERQIKGEMARRKIRA